MMGSWVISAVIRFSSNGITTMRSLQTEGNKLNAVLDSHTSKIQRAQAALESYRGKMMQIGATASGVMALAGVGFTAVGLKMAADLQRSLTGVNIATFGKDPVGMRKLVMQVSGMTAQNATTIANELAMLSSAGFNDTERLKKAFPTFAKAADVAWLSPHHYDPAQTVKSLAQFSHLLGIYSGPKMTQMVDDAIKLMYLQPESLQSMTRQMKYFAARASSAGVPMDQIFQQLMLMGQTGFLQGRGGSGMGMYIARMEGAASLTDSMTKRQRAGAIALGLFDSKGHNRFISHDAQGREIFDLMGSISYLAKRAPGSGDKLEMAASKFTQALSNFGTASVAQVISAETRPATQTQQQRNISSFGKIASVNQQWQQFMGNFLGQFSRAATNLQNVVIDIWTPELKDFTGWFKGAADQLGRFGDWLNSHPDIAQDFARGIMAFTVVMGGIWAAFSIRLAWTAIQLPIAIARMELALDSLTATVAADSTAIGASSTTAAGGLGALGGALTKFIGLLGILALRVAPLGATLSLKGDEGPQQGWSNPYYVPSMRRGSKYLIKAGSHPVFQRSYGGHALDPLLNPTRTPGLPGGAARPRTHADTKHHTTITVGRLEINFPNVKDGAGAKLAMEDVFLNPRSLLATSSHYRTHANLPPPLTVAPA